MVLVGGLKVLVVWIVMILVVSFVVLVVFNGFGVVVVVEGLIYVFGGMLFMGSGVGCVFNNFVVF